MREHIRAARRCTEPAQDDLRTQRVLQEVITEAKKPVREEAPRRRRLPLWGVAAVAALAAGLMATWLLRDPAPAPLASETGLEGAHRVATATVGEGPPVPHRVMAPPDATSPSVVRFVDGSRAEVNPGGELMVQAQTPRHIHLVQRAGRVRYRVKPGLSRDFVVIAGAVEIRVIGTDFTVTMTPPRVSVEVTQGTVEASDRARRVRLHSGERVLLGKPQSRLAPGTTEPLPTRPPGNDRMPPADARPRPAPRLSVGLLLKQADQARRGGQLERAATLLRRVTRHPTRDPRRTTAWFILAQVESRRQRYASAAEAYRRYRRAAPRSLLAADALAGEARARWSAGQHGRARTLAREYRRRYPRGAHLRAMRDILN